MIALQKKKPWRNSKYRDWIKKQACCWTGKFGSVEVHHLIGSGMGGTMGGKSSDLWSIPLDAQSHKALHDGKLKLDQKALVLKMIEKAVNDGVLVMGTLDAFDSWCDGIGDDS